MLQALEKNKSKLLKLYIQRKRDGQKYHFTLKTYDGCKATNFGDMKGIKMKRPGPIYKY